ncbi:hypothetical protein ACJJID_05465 [Microbulbifer sp. CnH-101-G]|uniref:DUF7660 family protein n=1 Tax=Microbulbifer sp. CnH-101-G TaxID=3243393 RepID=UPI00403A1AEE
MNKLNLLENLNQIKTRDDFSKFVLDILNDYKNNSSSWENADLASFLEAIAAWADDMDGFYANQGEEIPENIHWKVFAEILYAARMYE